MVAGGGASVVYADTISDFGYGHELANYGEYSGAPSTEHTFQYAKTLINLMTKEKDPKGKILIIGGGIANFTDVALTFTGLINALVNCQHELKAHHVRRCKDGCLSYLGVFPQLWLNQIHLSMDPDQTSR